MSRAVPRGNFLIERGPVTYVRHPKFGSSTATRDAAVQKSIVLLSYFFSESLSLRFNHHWTCFDANNLEPLCASVTLVINLCSKGGRVKARCRAESIAQRC